MDIRAGTVPLRKGEACALYLIRIADDEKGLRIDAAAQLLQAGILVLLDDRHHHHLLFIGKTAQRRDERHAPVDLIADRAADLLPVFRNDEQGLAGLRTEGEHPLDDLSADEYRQQPDHRCLDAIDHGAQDDGRAVHAHHQRRQRQPGVFVDDQRRDVHAAGAAVYPVHQPDAQSDADARIDRRQDRIGRRGEIARHPAEQRDEQRIDDGAEHRLQEERLSQAERADDEQADRQRIDDQLRRQMKQWLQRHSDAGRPAGQDIGRQDKKRDAAGNDEIAQDDIDQFMDPFTS